MRVFGRCLTGALIVAALSLGTWIAVSAQGRGEIKLNCQDSPCDAVARGRVAFNDRNLHGLGGNGRACADCHIPSESFLEASAGQTGPAANRSELIAVTSKDGTRIGVECAGTGPTLLFVHGGVGDRTRWTPMFPLLASRFTVCAMDRRGRGASGDSAEYSLLKEAEDVAAVVNSRAGTVFVFGHSLGGVAALEATFLTDRIARLMLYEPPLHDPAAVAATVEEMVERGELERALVMFQTEIVKQSPEEIARMKTRSTWAGLVASMAVLPRTMRALAAYRFDASRMKSVTMPTLLLIGEETASPYAKQSIGALRESLPNPTLVVLERQEHNAMEAGRDLLASVIVKFASAKE